MRDKLESIIERYNSIQDQMAESEIISNPDKLKDLAKEYKQLEPVVITGKKYIKRSGFCLETQFFPNSPNEESFPSTVLVPGAKFRSTTTFKFSLSKN